MIGLCNVVREYVFYVFFQNSKKNAFLRFLENEMSKNVENVRSRPIKVSEWLIYWLFTTRFETNTYTFTHTTPILKSLHWLKINQRIEYKILSLTYKVLTRPTAQPGYIRNLISVDSPHIETRSSSSVTLSRPSSSSSLKSLTAHFVMHLLAFGINFLPHSVA